MEDIQGLIEGVSEKLEPDQLSTDMPTRIVHRLSHGPESLLHEDLSDFTPALVVRPKSTEEVVRIVELANEYEVPIVPQGGRTATYGGEGMRDCLVVDLSNMNKIIRLDEATYRITAEAGS